MTTNMTRPERRRAARLNAELDKPFTTTKRAYFQLAEQEAQKLYDKNVEKLTKQIGESLMFGITKTVGLVTAMALEDVCKFGIKRIGRVIAAQMKYICHMNEVTFHKVNIKQFEKYWADKGLTITDNEKGETTLRIGRD